MMKQYQTVGLEFLREDALEAQREEEVETKKECCTWTHIRRAFRIIFLLLVLAVIIVVPVIYIALQHTYETNKVSTDKVLRIKLKDCKLYIAEESSLGKTEIELESDIPGSDFSLTTTSVHELVAKSSISYVDACIVDMRIHPEATLQGLEVSCEGTCRVSHYGPSSLNLGSGSLTLTGDTIKFMSPKTKAGRVYVSVAKGDIHLYNVELPSGTYHTLSTGEGDIVVQSLNSMRLDWTQNLNNFCLYAPTVSAVGSPKADCEASLNGAKAASSCATGYLLCRSGDACTSALSTPVITAGTGLGNIYANVIPAHTQPVSESSSSVRGFNYTYGPNTNSYMNMTIASLSESLKDSSGADPLIWVALGNQEAFATAGQIFLFAANAAYLNAYPWWISFFSASLLMGKMHKLDGNLAPGFCPFYTLPTTSRIATAKSLVASKLDMLSDTADAAFVYGPDFPQPKSSPTNCDGFRGTEGGLQLYSIVFEGESYRMSEYGLAQNTALLMAVIISVILALLIGLLGLYAALLGLDSLLTHSMGQYKQLSAYSQRLERESVAENPSIRPGQVADVNAIQDHLEGEEKHGLIASVFIRLPSQYMLIDILVREMKNWLTSSVDVFYDFVFESLEPDDIDDFRPVLFRDIKVVYEQFCFLKQITEEDLLNDANIARLKSRGFVLERMGKSVELLNKVRWITQDEEIELRRNPVVLPSTAASLDIFVRNRCVTTNFSSDSIEFEAFLRAYEEYCIEKRLEMQVVTRAQLHDSFGIESANESPYYLKRVQSAQSSKARSRFDLDKVKNLNQEMIKLNAGTASKERQVTEGTDPSVKISGVRMFIFDMISVLLHLVSLVLLSAFVVVIPMFVELEISNYSLSDYRYKFHYEDLKDAPWNIPSKLMYVSTTTVVALIFAGLYIVVGVVDLIIYYRYKTFPTESLKNIQKMKINIVSRILQYFIWFFICVLVIMLFTYFGLVAVWSVLGAIMNPNAYLAYGAAAITFVSFVGAKLQQFKTLQTVGFQALEEMLFSKLQELLDGIMKKILAQAGFAAELIEQGKDLQSGLVDRAERVIRASPIGKTLAAIGLDPQNVIAGLQGDEEALIEIGCKQGIPRDVMVLLLAMVKGKRRELIEGLQKFASSPEFQLDPGIIDFAVEVVLNKSELNIPVLISRASQIFFTLAYNQVKSAMGEHLDQEKMDYLDICRQVFPRLISAFKHFRTEEIDMFVECYEEVNDFIFNSVKKRASALATSQKQVFSKLFNEKGEPVFALPSYILKGIRIFNLIALGEGGKTESGTISRVLSAIYYILENFLGADPRITNMLNLILSSSREMIMSPNMKDGLLPIEEQNKVLVEICEILELPPSLFSMAWKIFTGNYEIDDEFVSQVSKFVNEKMEIEVSPNALKLIMHFFSVIYSSLSKGSLMSDAKKFGVEQPLATVVYLFGKSKIPPAQFGSIMQNSVFQGVISKLRISSSDAFGLLSLLKGEYFNPSLFSLFDSLKKRWNLTSVPSEVIASLLALFLSADENELIRATKRLGLYPYEFALIARRLLHPGSVSLNVFESLGLLKDNPLILHRIHIPEDDEAANLEWRKAIIQLLSGDYRSVKSEGKEKRKRRPTKAGGAREKGGKKKRGKESKKEEKVVKPESKKGGKKDEAKKEKEKEGKEAKEGKEEKGKEEEKKAAEDMGDDVFEEQGVESFTEEEKRLRADARLLLELAEYNITETNLKDLLDRVPVPVKIDPMRVARICEHLNVLLYALKVLKELTAANKVKSAVQLIADVMQVEQQPLAALVSLIYLQEKDALVPNLTFLVKGILTKHESEELVEYCTYLLDKSKVIQKAEESIKFIALETRIPKFVVRMMFSPLKDQSASNILMDECLTLLDYAGLNPEALAENEIAFKWPTEYSVNVDEFRINLAGVIMGHTSMLINLLGTLGFPESALHLAKAVTAGKRVEIFRSIHVALYPIMKQFGMSQSNFYIVLEILKFFNGMGDQAALDPRFAGNGYEYLKKTVGIVPEFLFCIEAYLQRSEGALIECLPKLFNAINEFDLIEESMKISPDIISGVLTLLSGDNKSLEKMAEKMRVSQEFIELCMKLMNIKKGKESEIPKRLLSFQQSPLIAKVWTALGIPSELMDVVMVLSFGAFNHEDLNEILKKLNIKQHTEPVFLSFVISIIRSWTSLQSIEEEPMFKGSERRILPLEGLKTFLTPVAKRLMINPELVLIGLRLRQGDFYIIEEHSTYLNILLPNKNVRRMAMGLCGMLTLPPRFKRRFKEYPDVFKHSVSFESACEMLCELLNINPIVARMMLLDEATLNLIEEDFGMSRKALTWFIFTLTHMPLAILEAIALRELKKQIFLKRRHCEEILKHLDPEEGTSKKTVDAGEKKERELGQEDEERSSESPRMNESGSIMRSEDDNQSESGYSDSEYSQNEDEDDGSERSGMESEEQAPERPAGGSEEKTEEEKKVKVSMFRNIMKAMLAAKMKLAGAGNFFDSINLDGPEYENCPEDVIDGDGMSVENEKFECMLFNDDDYTSMNYDFVTNKKHREGVFSVSDQRVTDLFGYKEEYYKDMAKTFFVNPEDPEIWLNKETLDLSKKWTVMDNRKVRKNVWAELKKLLARLSDDQVLTNKAKHKYDRITLAQMAMFMLVMRIRKRMNSTYEAKKDESAYNIYIYEMECLAFTIESLTLTKGLFGKNYSRLRMLKVVSLALNANFANIVDHELLPSLYSGEFFYEFKEQYQSREELQKFIEYCDSMDENLGPDSDSFDCHFCFSELEEVLVYSRDDADATACRAENCCPYVYENVEIPEYQFDYEEDKDDLLMQGLSKDDLAKRKQACVRPEDLIEDNIDPKSEDPISRQPYSEVVKMMGSIEAYFVIEQEKLDFFLDLAIGQWNVFDKLAKVFAAAGYLKNANSRTVYKALSEVLALRKKIKDWQADPEQRKLPFSTNAVSNLFSFLLKRVNEGLINDILLLSHGVLNYSTIKDLSAKYGLDYKLTQSFFLAGYTEDLFQDEDMLMETLSGLLERLGLGSKGDLILTMIDMYKGRKQGWEEMAKYCCFDKPNAIMILKCIVQMLPWDKRVPNATPGLINASNMFLHTSKELPTYLASVVSFLVEKETGALKELGNPKLQSALGLCYGIVRQDLEQVLLHTSSLKDDLGLAGSNSYDLLKSFVVLMGNHSLPDSSKRTALIKSAADVLGNWITSLLNFSDESKREGLKKKLKMFVMVALGGRYRDWKQLKAGLTGIDPVISKVVNIWNYISSVLKYVKEIGVPMKRLKKPTILSLMNSFVFMVDLGVYLSSAKEETMKELQQNASKSHANPMKFYAELSEMKVIGKSYKSFSCFQGYINDRLSSVKDEMLNTPIELCEAYEVDLEKKDYLKEAMDELMGNHQYQDYGQLLKFVIPFLIRDVDFMLSYLETNGFLSPLIVSTFRMVDRIFKLDKKEFRNLINDPEAFKKYEGDLAKYFVSPLAEYIRSYINQKLKEKLGAFEMEMYKRAKAMSSDVKLLSQMVMLLHFLRYGSIRKQSVQEIMMTIFEALNQSLSSVLQKYFPKLILALFGFEDAKGSKAMVSFLERRNIFINMFIEMCIPDLLPKLDLVEKLLQFGTFLLKVGGNPELIWENKEKIIDWIGSLMGVNPQVIQGIFGAIKGDFQALVDFVAPVVRINPKTLKTVSKVFNGCMSSVSYVTQDSSASEKKVDDVERSNWMALMKKVGDGQASVRELFQLVDMEGNNSGGISVEEFANLTKKLGMSMTHHRITEIFARCKSRSSPLPDELNIQEFEEAIKYVQSKRVLEGLNLLGISTNQLVFLFLMLAIILILLFVFIFLGITAFSLGGTFGSIINSMLPCGAGFTVGSNSPINPKDLDWVKKLKEAAEEVIEMVGGDL